MPVKTRKLIRLILLIFTTGFVLLNVMAAFHAWKFTHFYPGAPKPKNPGQLSLSEKTGILFFGLNVPKSVNTKALPVPHDTVQLLTSEGIIIDGWLARNSNNLGTVALFHGHSGCKSGVVDEAVEFYNLGYSVFLIDFRGHGNSSGTNTTIGYKEAEEVRLMFDYLKHKGEKKIIVWGTSMGAVAIIRACSEYGIRPAAAILELPYGSLRHAVVARTKLMGIPPEPVATLLTFWGGTQNGFNAFSVKPAQYVRYFTCPVLLQAGKQDIKVSLSEINDIFYNLASTKKKKVIYDFSGHQSLLNNENIKWKAEVSSFLNSF